MSGTDDKHYQPRRFKAEVKRAKVVRKRDIAPEQREDAYQNDVETAPLQEQESEPVRPVVFETAEAIPEDPSEERADSQAAGTEAETAAESAAPQADSEPQEKYVDKTVVLPQESFDYVVPKETFKQHARRKHKSEHSGTTKTASKEELEEMDAGYVFLTPRKHRKRKKSHQHHHHRRFRHLALWKRILIIFAAVLLALIIALGGTYLVLNEIGRRSMHHYENVDIDTPAQDESGNEIIQVDKRGQVITYDGVSYELNDNIISVTFIGADAGTGDNASLQMADAIYVLTVDTETGKVKILGISRDTMSDVDLYSEQGSFIDTQRMQMAFSYAYGSDTVTGGKNTNISIKRLFYGLPFEDYFAINMNALITLNDTIGGVTLTSSMTFTSPIDGRTINEGDTVTLHGKEANYYVRYRDTSKLDSNNDRMKRQQEYIRAFIGSIIPAAKKDLSTVTNLYNEIQVNSDTTLDLPKMTYIASTALTKLDSASDIEYISLKGEITEGEYAEMNVSNESAIRTMLDVFYTPLADVPEQLDK